MDLILLLLGATAIGVVLGLWAADDPEVKKRREERSAKTDTN